MPVKKRALGRGLNDLGLNELLSGVDKSVPALKGKDEDEQNKTFRHIAIQSLQPGKYQPRRDMDEDALQELAASIMNQGIIQPIIVRAVANNRFEIIAGERRWRAAQINGFSEVPCLVKDLPDEAVIAMSLIENIQREDLNAIEEAAALQRLINEFNLTHQEVAQAVGKSRTTVTNLLRLLNLHPNVQTMLEHGDLEMGHARALLSLDEEVQLHIAEKIVANDLTVREAEKLAQNPTTKPNQAERKIPPVVEQETLVRQQHLTERLGTKVKIKQNPKGRGKIEIHFKNALELEAILGHIQ